MSYSFNVRAASKAAVVAAASAELDKVVAAQPVHAAERAQAQAAVEAFVGLVAEPEGTDQELSVSVNGSVGSIDGELRGCGFGVYVGFVPLNS